MSRLRSFAHRLPGRLAVFAVCAAAGAMISMSASVSGGVDLRSSRNTDLVSLVSAHKHANDEQAAEVARLRDEVDELTKQQVAQPESSEQLDTLVAATDGVAVKGQGVVVTLNDAPLDVKPAGVDPDLLVVHQQDIQSVMNVLWASGAEAMTVQGQRVGPTTGIKCVGNTVSIRGVPYAPPYQIAAIGDADRLEAGLSNSSFVKAYQKFVEAYDLGYAEKRSSELSFPAYRSPQQLAYARP